MRDITLMDTLLTQKIEAILLYKAEPQSMKMLAHSAGASPTEIAEALQVLRQKYGEGSGIVLVIVEETVALATAPTLHTFMEALTRGDDEKELGAAALETLALILWQAPIAKSTIDRVRGVNAGYILRHLLIRGLIERKEDPKAPRSFVYYPTVELLAYLGVTSREQLPDGASFASAIAAYLQASTPPSSDSTPAS